MRLRYLLILFTLLGWSMTALAGPPGWSVNVNDYSNSMTVTGAINIDYQESRDTDDIVAAFVNGTCRGVGQPMYVPQLDRYIVFLLIYGDTPSEEIEFRVYDASQDGIRTISAKMEFQVNGIIGSSVHPYIWSNPELSDEADITDFGFSIPGSSTTIVGDSIIVDVPYLTDTTALVANFTTSPQAYVRVDGVLQASGVTVNNFGKVVQYDVLSADETTEQSYFVKINVIDARPTDLFLLDSTLLETAAIDTYIGDFEVEDPDGKGENDIYLTSNAATDNHLFNVQFGKLYSNAVFDYENQQEHTIEVTVTNELGLSLTKMFTVYIVDENDETPYIVQDTVKILEDATLPMLVHTMVVEDRDSSAAFKDHSFVVVTGNEDQRFSLNKQTGQIYLINPVDYESSTLTYELEFQVTDGVFSTNSSIIFQIIDVNDGIPEIETANIDILESRVVGSDVHKVVATDIDANSVLTYAILGGNTGDAFEIDPATGLITIKNELDYEQVTDYLLEIEVSDGLNVNTAFFPINVIDINDEYPIVEIDTVQISENGVLGQIVHTIQSTDPDEDSRLRYTITNGNEELKFTINPGYGIITLLQPLDFEQTERYFLEVTVDDGGLKTVIITVIEIINENDEDPIVTPDSIYLSEDHFQFGYVGQVVANDPDNLVDLSYAITGGNTNSSFSIDPVTGIITLDSLLDYETQTRFDLVVTAYDGVDEGSETISIFVSNINDELPIVLDANISVSEDEFPSTILYTVLATDPDNLDPLTYSFLSGNDDGRFDIDASTGVIKLIAPLDYETVTGYVLEVDVFDGLQSSIATINVEVLNANDEPPQVEDLEIFLSEATPIGFILDTLNVTDPDGVASGFYFSLNNPNNVTHFDVESSLGYIRTTQALDYETTPSFSFQVRVSDGSQMVLGNVTLNIEDVNDNSPVIAEDSSDVDETISVGSVIHTAVATDRDSNPVLRYSYNGAYSSLFEIDSLTGEITVVGELDFEQQTRYELNITVSDTLFETVGKAIIVVNDINDEMPSLVDTTFLISEYTSRGTDIGQLMGHDLDADTEFEFTLMNNEGRFSLSSDGYLVLEEPLDYETEPMVELIVEVYDGANATIDTLFIEVGDENEKLFDADNTFSPNGDGVNDIWQIRTPGAYGDCLFTIFNQFGQEVFQQTGYDNPWDGQKDGRDLPVGTYYYVVECANCSCNHSGYISLIR